MIFTRTTIIATIIIIIIIMTKVKAIWQFPLINQTGHGRGGPVELLSSDKTSLPGYPFPPPCSASCRQSC